MLDKIRLHANGELDPDYHDNLGSGADGRCADFLRVPYDALRARVLEGGSDSEVLEWCFATGRRLNKGDVIVWNSFISKLGWSDFASGHLEKAKAAAGLGHRKDIQTMPQLFEVEEGRAP
jgi:gluconokinase